MRERPGQKIKLKTIDEMLGVVGEESAMEIEIEKIHPFRNHPFHVVDDAKMQDLIDSIRENGILSPTLIRPVGNDEYEMVSGHRRMHAAMKLGMETIPAIIRDMTDDEAIVKMVDSNIQREELLPSEKAFAYKMKLEAMRRTAGRPSNNLSQNGTNFRVDQEIANQVNESRNQIRRYIRLTELIPELLDFVDRRRLQFTVAVEISYIDKEIQGWLFEYIRENGPVKLNQVKELRTALQTGAMTQDKMIVLLNGTQKSTSAGSLTLTDRKLREYFPPTYSHDDMMDVIETLLKSWKAQNGGDSDDV
ncbi:ParB/RepB/Spo0J family partition protein [Porcincola intestinalis]|jgi:ParB family chromosome partitioning protein|uniref:ParB/RepB/Spo0J family partition protein n=1 Tax=Porcincola intestinalis TaxID=2606632 RepID=UPI002A81EAAC|nr:ParB/RepB/Spo0J family partition protein [Porcincola intestinalis]MDY4205103.1 ParB/RepB/Spo0J family partition protein [Porcincola intestinalis]